MNRTTYTILALSFIDRVRAELPKADGCIYVSNDGTLRVTLQYEVDEEDDSTTHVDCCGACQNSTLAEAVEKCGAGFLEHSIVEGGGTQFDHGRTRSDVDFCPAATLKAS